MEVAEYIEKPYFIPDKPLSSTPFQNYHLSMQKKVKIYSDIETF